MPAKGAPLVQEAQPGWVIGGRHRLDSVLGAGGFGQVWKAYDQLLQVEVAVKEVRPSPTGSPAKRASQLQHAKREALNAAKLRGRPDVVDIYDAVVEHDALWIVMQLIDGCSLADHIERHGPLSASRTMRVATTLLNALAAAHEKGIVHRDVKPQNVMLAAGGDILLTDFGIAAHEDDTASSQVAGTWAYVAPERFQGISRLPASDLFSVGVTLYELVEGFSPFRRDTFEATVFAVISDQAPPPQRAGQPLATLIERLLEKDPNRRPTVDEALAMTTAPPARTRVVTAAATKRPNQRARKSGMPNWVARGVIPAVVSLGLIGVFLVLDDAGRTTAGEAIDNIDEIDGTFLYTVFIGACVALLFEACSLGILAGMDVHSAARRAGQVVAALSGIVAGAAVMAASFCAVVPVTGLLGYWMSAVEALITTAVLLAGGLGYALYGGRS
ncbi:serine/threonine-protein kinase [Flindersiella endophytica]